MPFRRIQIRIKNRSDFMNKKNTLKKTAALLLGLALTVGATGCNFIVPDTAADYDQTIATVDITKALANDKDFDKKRS